MVLLRLPVRRTVRPVSELRCSARACSRPAAFAMLWNNPRVHTPERRKVWLACDDHRTYLHEYLQLRGLLKDDVPVDEIPAGAG
ncbi:hypothetical protein M3C50_05100 [Brevibacterium luteolum]|uniref:Acetone carboxylase n=1 Tax=Brevibacterium luteolum TaxID=199591 RepID=A0A2N6PKR2_9MICO|nr:MULTISPECIES: hypothetical protein [Brevibacterium]MCT1829284.1 hypothetical protein [Brevibacterium luteolum]MCT1873213.1 hypothetical protein [Brevibacterium luteolum]MCT1890332.1 hypothetical protein [Brevibacterium luteolum]MCT1893772.1 hypothetical protein [Brevibacterium luteolum]MCT1921179.1 hypothetical protein [Brevibacterium luteolum]